MLCPTAQATQKTPDLAEVVARAGAPACLQTFMTLEAGNREGMLAGCMIIGVYVVMCVVGHQFKLVLLCVQY